MMCRQCCGDMTPKSNNRDEIVWECLYCGNEVDTDKNLKSNAK